MCWGPGSAVERLEMWEKDPVARLWELYIMVELYNT